MSFIFRRKKFRFLVALEVEDLSLTPFVNGILFVKIRLANGGSLEEYTTREEVFNNRVEWKKKCQFECRIYANNSTAELETCLLRLSVRKECKGGKTYQKLGFADINLSEFAGSGSTTRRYLLEGYSSRTRLDNSMIQVSVSMKLLGGDPVFKVPKPKTVPLLGQEMCDVDLNPENKGAVSGSEDSVTSASSGFDSLTRNKTQENTTVKDSSNTPKKAHPEVKKTEAQDDKSSTLTSGTALCPSSFQGHDEGQGHYRNSSSTSEMSKVSGYHSLGGVSSCHSRTSSYDNSNICSIHHKRSSSADAAEAHKIAYLATRKKVEQASSIEQRLGSTRVDAETVIENLLRSTDFKEEDTVEKQGLELFVAPDGTTALSSQQLRDKAGKFERVIIGNR